MKKKTKVSVKSKYMLAVITVFCLLMIFLSFVTDITMGPLKTFSGFIIVPFQNGINNVGSWLTDKGDYFKSLDELVKANQDLQSQMDELEAQNNLLLQESYKTERYDKLVDLMENYSDYDMMPAKVISANPDNWFDTFMIDKGSDDGLAKDMNVLAAGDAQGGLAGIIIDVGPKWAKVRSVVDDVSTISAEVLNTSDTCIVAGDLSLKDEGKIHLLKLKDPSDNVQTGDMVVTSHISEKFHADIKIGYIDSLVLDSNNMTKSGYIIPYVNFDNIKEVLVITELKETGGDGSISENPEDDGANSDDQSNEGDAGTNGGSTGSDEGNAGSDAGDNGDGNSDQGNDAGENGRNDE